MSTDRHHIRFATFVALRYLFSKKKRNSINIISAVSVCGVVIGTMALVCVMSVFNGFEQLVQQLFGYFDPDLKIEAVNGKTFHADAEIFGEVRNMEGVITYSEALEDNVLLSYRNLQTPAVLKGVDRDFVRLVETDSILYDGAFVLDEGRQSYGVLGVGIAAQLSVTPQRYEALHIYVPKRNEKINTVRPESSFNQETLPIAGIFSIKQPDYDNRYLLTSIDKARVLFERDSTEVSSIELAVERGKIASVQRTLKKVLGADYTVKNKYEQQEEYFRIMQIEKWISFLILIFILLIATFNIIGSLSMLIIDKKEDIETLRSVGASESLIKRIFLLEGWLIAILGAVIGVVLGLLVCFGQQHFGWITMGENYIVNAYPVIVKFTDILLIFAMVMVLGLLASYYPVRYLKKRQL